MADLKTFTVFADGARIGTLSARARFLDNRAEKTIQLDRGGQIVVASDALKVQPDGSFLLKSSAWERHDIAPPNAASVSLSGERPVAVMDPPTLPSPAIPNEVQVPMPENDRSIGTKVGERNPGEKLFRDGYSIEHVKLDRIISEPVSQRQEGDTLILPVMEEILVLEKRLILREEIRITRSRDEIAE